MVFYLLNTKTWCYNTQKPWKRWGLYEIRLRTNPLLYKYHWNGVISNKKDHTSKMRPYCWVSDMQDLSMAKPNFEHALFLAQWRPIGSNFLLWNYWKFGNYGQIMASIWTIILYLVHVPSYFVAHFIRWLCVKVPFKIWQLIAISVRVVKATVKSTRVRWLRAQV